MLRINAAVDPLLRRSAVDFVFWYQNKAIWAGFWAQSRTFALIRLSNHLVQSRFTLV
jgi:hypothetical protein